ncbi:hypothetical protein [Paenibacillus planticolens]|uniref:Uncharacterized protein n=1 Tax=Paenibacillus planticolens TaxID=2654976 RepID=A0ABX1ZMP9_9BACL|nr:hypothetical protein [Paenibacillus planticolens]NOV01364.1 hypothetical protein [Paenibacillus planticolens]
MANTQGMAFKFQVIKGTDIEQLSHYNKVTLGHIVERVGEIRKEKGKKDNTYLVINTDEPYADEVIEIMKRHGHWG